MPLDPNIALSVNQAPPPDPMQAAQKAFALKSMVDENKMRQQAMQQQLMLRDAFSKADTSTPQGKSDLVNKVSQIDPKQGMALRNSFSEEDLRLSTMRKNFAQAKESDLKLWQGKNSVIADATAPLSAQYQSLKQKGLNDQQIMQQMEPAYQEMLKQMVNAKGPDGEPILTREQLLQTPQHFDPNFVNQQAQNSNKTHALISNELNSRRLEEQQRHNKAMEKKADLKVVMGENASLDDETLTFMARQALAGDQSVKQGLGVGVQGSKNRVALQKKMASLAKEQGISPEVAAQRNAEFFGMKAAERTVGTRTANVELAVNEALNVIPVVQEASKKFERTQFPPVNKALAAFEEGTGDPNVVAFGQALNSFINVYARAINPTGVPTVQDKMHAQEILSRAHTNEQLNAALDVMTKEMEAAKRAPAQVKQGLRDLASDKKESSQSKDYSHLWQ